MISSYQYINRCIVNITLTLPDFDSKFKNEISKLYNNEGYHDSVAEIDWKIYDKVITSFTLYKFIC